MHDLRTNKHFTQKQNPIKRADFDEFVDLFKPGVIHKHKATWAEDKPDGRWRCFDYEELAKRDNDELSLDLFWIKDESVEDSSTLPDPDELCRRSWTTWKMPSNSSRPLPGTLKKPSLSE